MFTVPAYSAANIDDHQYIEASGESVNAMISGVESDHDQVMKSLETLKSSLRRHFIIEENIMSDLGYHGLLEHSRSHTIIISQVSDCLHLMASGDDRQNINIWPRVKAMLRYHMQRFDQDLVHHLEQAVERPGLAVAPSPSLGALI